MSVASFINFQETRNKSGQSLRLIRSAEDRTGKWTICAHVAGGYHSLEPAAPDINLHRIANRCIAVQYGKADRPLAGLVQDNSLPTLTLEDVIGNHGAAGDKADLPVSIVYLHARAHDTFVQQGDGQNPAGKIR